MLSCGGVEVPNAQSSPVSRVLDGRSGSLGWPADWPYSDSDLTPEDSSNDQLFYLVPKFVHHAGEECRQSLSDYYACVLPEKRLAGDGAAAVLDLCSSWTSHYPKEWNSGGQGDGRVRCVALGLNAAELLFNPSKTEWVVRNLNTDPSLPFGDDEVKATTQ